MYSRSRTFMLWAALFLCGPLLFAQAVVNPFGHWEGVVHTPGGEMSVQIDLTRNALGDAVGTIRNREVTGLPVSDLAIVDRLVSFQLGTVPGDRVFSGVLSEKGSTMFGTFVQDGFPPMPVDLTRTGEARVDVAPTSAAIGKEWEGTWSGMLAVAGSEFRVLLKLSNQPGGTSVGTLVNLDEGGLELPITTITQQGARLTLDVKTVGGSYTGALAADGNELSGTWTQGRIVAPLTYRRVVPPPSRP